MRRFIITGAPGAGKTAIIRQLELDGFSVVEEAATDLFTAAQAQGTVQPWMHPSFIDVVANLQRDRQIRASHQPDEVQFHDRARHRLSVPPPDTSSMIARAGHRLRSRGVRSGRPTVIHGRR